MQIIINDNSKSFFDQAEVREAQRVGEGEHLHDE
jgi:hypothetical protein